MQDIGKYVVFTFDNKLNSIVPVLTKYDYENNAVYASVDHEGTYFIADLEKWKESIQDISVKDYSDMQEGTEKADVVFSVNISGGITAEEDLKKMKDNILRNVEKLFEENNDIRVSVIGYSQKFIDGSHCQHTYLDQLNKKEEWATKVQDVITLLSQLKVDNSSSKGYLEYGTQDISYPFIGAGVPCDYREDADKYAFVYTLSSKMGTHYLGSLTGYSYARICPMGTILERMSARSIKLSFVFEQDMSDTGFAQFMKEKADGTYIMYTPDEKGKQPMGVYDYVKQNTKFSNGSDNDPTHGRTMFISSLSLKPITLSAPLYANGKNDTDSDGLTDWEEVRKNIEGFPVPMMIESSTDKYGYTGIPKFVDALMCRTHSADDPIFEFLKSKLGSDYDDIMQLPCLILNSDPTKPDTDYDGLNDKVDNNNMSTQFTGILDKDHEGDSVTTKVVYSFCLKDFFNSNLKYNSDLSTFSLLMSAAIYDKSYIIDNSSNKKRTASDMLVHHGFENVKTYKLEEGFKEFNIDRYKGDLNNKDDLKDLDHHISEVCVGHQKVTYNGQTKDIVAVIVRGTNGTITEWTSNMDIGSTEERDLYLEYEKTGDTSKFDYTLNYLYKNNLNELKAFEDWKTEANHKGFDIATNRILRFVKTYTDKYVDKEHTAYWVTGHSRGGAIANLLSAYLVDEDKEVYAYTFAAPNTTTNTYCYDNIYNCIFNIINKDDFVPTLPCEKWGFNKFGKTKEQSVSNYKIEWETMMADNVEGYLGNEESYNEYHYDSSLDNTVDKISNLVENRNECYTQSHILRQYSKPELLDNTRPYCKIEKHKEINYMSEEYYYTIDESPIYYFQVLAAVMADVDGSTRAFLSFATHYGYITVTISLGISQLELPIKFLDNGLACPHFIQSYYVLSKHIN